jgi:hypothetical protein
MPFMVAEGKAHSIYISDEEWKDYAILVKNKTGDKIGPHIVELLRRDREALNGKPVIASPEGIEKLRNQSIQLEKEKDVIVSILEDHEVSDSLFTLCERYGLDTDTYSNAQVVMAALTEKMKEHKLDYSDFDILRLIDLLEILVKKRNIDRKLFTIRCEMYLPKADASSEVGTDKADRIPNSAENSGDQGSKEQSDNREDRSKENKQPEASNVTDQGDQEDEEEDNNEHADEEGTDDGSEKDPYTWEEDW